MSAGGPLPAASYPCAKSYANWVLTVTVSGAVLFAFLAMNDPRFVVFLASFVSLAIWGLVLRFDRRPYVDVSADGIWCRAWSPTRYRYNQFKAVYPRQRAGGLRGVVLVPYSAAEIERTLSPLGRYLLRSGGGVPAHARTLTLWTTRIGVNRDVFLRGLRAAIESATPSDQTR